MKANERRSDPLRNTSQTAASPKDAAADKTRQSLRELGDFDAQARALEPEAAAPLQLEGPGRGGAAAMQRAAVHGTAGQGGTLPHLEAIQASFGAHDVSGVQSHVGGRAAEACDAMGAQAYASGGQVAFGARPDLHTAAHEAAHVVQQRAGVSLYGGVGKAGDSYERHADADADRVVAGKSAEDLLDGVAAGGGGGAAGGAAGAVQLYTRVPRASQTPENWQADADVRVADDGRMAVPEGESHRMFATPGIIAEAAQLMASMGSRFSIAPGEATIKGPNPEIPGATRTLIEAVPRDLSSGLASDEMTTQEACSTHGQEMMGAAITQGEHPHQFGLAGVVGGQESNWNRVRGGDNDIVGTVRDQMSGYAGEDREASERRYGRLSDRTRATRARELGVNEHADPQAGEALAVYNAMPRETAKLSERARERRGIGAPMHFAAVIARSGGDYVTHENYAKDGEGGRNPRAATDTEAASKAWYFRMYGPVKRRDDQSFYGEYVRAGEQGGKKQTMVLKHKRVAGFANESVVEGEECLRRWQPFANSEKFDRRYTPLFKTTYEEFVRVFRAYKNDGLRAWEQNTELPAARREELDQAIEACKATEIGALLYDNPSVAAAPEFEAEQRARWEEANAVAPILLDLDEDEDEDEDKTPK